MTPTLPHVAAGTHEQPRLRMPSLSKSRTLYIICWTGVAVLLSVVASNLFDGGASIERSHENMPEGKLLFWMLAVAALVFSPVVETAFMSLQIIVLQKMGMNRFVIILVSGICWAIVHEVLDRDAGRFIFFPFAIFSYVFIDRNRSGYADGFIVATMVHVLYNVAALVSMLPIRHAS